MTREECAKLVRKIHATSGQPVTEDILDYWWEVFSDWPMHLVWLAVRLWRQSEGNRGFPPDPDAVRPVAANLVRPELSLSFAEARNLNTKQYQVAYKRLNSREYNPHGNPAELKPATDYALKSEFDKVVSEARNLPLSKLLSKPATQGVPEPRNAEYEAARGLVSEMRTMLQREIGHEVPQSV